MTTLNWKDGGNKPLSYAQDCAICGEKIMVPTRDYYYAYDENEKAVRAHAVCAQKALDAGVSSGPSSEVMDHLIYELMMIREMLALIKEQLQRIADQGAH